MLRAVGEAGPKGRVQGQDPGRPSQVSGAGGPA